MRYLALGLIICGLLTLQVFIGGARLVFALPGYLLIAAAAIALLGVKRVAIGVREQKLSVIIGLLFAIYLLARSLLSPFHFLAISDLLMILAALIVYEAMTRNFVTPKDRFLALWFLLGFGVIHTIVGSIQFKYGKDFMLIPGMARPLYPNYGWRASGFYIYPSHLAGLLEMVGLTGLGVCAWGRWIVWKRMAIGYASAICLGGVAITGSRGGYISTFAGIFCLCLTAICVMVHARPGRYWKSVGGIAILAVSVLGAACFFMAKTHETAERLGSLYDPENGRFALWTAAIRQFRTAPLFGTGSGTYLYLGRRFRSLSIQGDPVHVHSDYLELLAEYGLIGGLLGGAFLGVLIVSGIRALRKFLAEKVKPTMPPFSNELGLLLGASAGVCAILIHSIMDFNLHLPANTLVAAFLLGILARPYVGGSDDTALSVHLGSRLAIWLVPAVGLALLIAGLPLVKGEYFGEQARVALRDHRLEESRQLALRALTSERSNPELYYYLGKTLHFMAVQAQSNEERKGLEAEAANALGDGVKLFPCDTRLLVAYAQILDLLGRYREAQVYFQMAVDSDPNLGSVYANLGVHWEMQQQFGFAERCWLKARELGETDISSRGLQRLEELKHNPLIQSLSPRRFEDGKQPGVPR